MQISLSCLKPIEWTHQAAEIFLEKSTTGDYENHEDHLIEQQSLFKGTAMNSSSVLKTWGSSSTRAHRALVNCKPANWLRISCEDQIYLPSTYAKAYVIVRVERIGK